MEFRGIHQRRLSENYNGQPLAFEKAVNVMGYVIKGLALFTVVLVIGRWGMFRKAGKKGWHSLVPFLNVYEEYSLCWNGWFGVIADLCTVAFFATGMLSAPAVLHWSVLLVNIGLGIPEGLTLAKAFGQSKAVGVLLAIPVVKDFAKMILGVSKAKYQFADAA